MSQWRQKKMRQQRGRDPVDPHTESAAEQNNGEKYIAPRMQSDESAHHPAKYNNKSRQWHANPGLDFKHRSNRYRQYCNNTKSGNYAYSSNNRKYNKRQYRNYEYNQSKSGNAHHNNKPKSTYDASTKINPKYLYCPQPRTSSLRRESLMNLSIFNYVMRVKSNGMKVKCYITQNSVYLIDASFSVRMLVHVFYASHGFMTDNKLTIFDGELFVAERTTKHSERNLFYRITDCIVFEGESLSHQNSSVRYQHIKKFMQVYESKLKEYAKTKPDTKSTKIGLFDGDFVPGDDMDTPQYRLQSISSLLDHNYQHTKNIKNAVINYCKSPQRKKRITKQCDDRKVDTPKYETEEEEGNDDADEYSLDDIQLDAVSVVFTQAMHYPVSKENLEKLSQCIEYKADSNNNGYAYYYKDISTGIMCKSEGIVFIPENNNYLMDRESSYVEKQQIWKPVDLLTVDIMIVKCKSNNNNSQKMKESITNDNSLKEMNDFIDHNILNMYVYDENKKQSNGSSSLIWFNSINMGENDVNDGLTPFWTEWHLKQRSSLCHFISVLHQQSKQPINEFIVECNYDFNNKSWSLYQLKLNAKRPSTLKLAQDVISQMEEFLQINDLIKAIQ